MSSFPALVLGEKKARKLTEEGIYEYVLRKRLYGFYFFKSKGFTARPIRRATQLEKEEAMKDVPVINAVTTMWNEDQKLWFSHPLNLNQVQEYRGLHFPCPLLLSDEDLSILQPIQTWLFYDRSRRVLIFKDLHFSYPMERLEKVKSLLEEPSVAHPDYLTLEELQAFEFTKKSTKPPIERLIEGSLQFVGAELIKYDDLGNGQYRVNWRYQGDTETATVNQQMNVLDAGMCLVDTRTGQHYQGHRLYDLGSIVLVKYNYRHRWD